MLKYIRAASNGEIANEKGYQYIACRRTGAQYSRICGFASGTPSGDGSGYREVLAEFIGQAEKLLNDSAFVPNDAERESLTHSLASAKTVYDNPASADEQLREAANHLKAQIESPLCARCLLKPLELRRPHWK